MPATLTPVSLRLTPEEYFDWEETQEEKHDYIYGEVFAMSGANRTHNDIAGNLAVALRLAFRGTECSAFSSDMRVQVEPDGRYTYPDLPAVCGEPTFLNARETTLVNPALVAEVLSPSTEAYDRGDKLATYRGVPSIREIVLVRQDRRAVEVYRREGEARWTVEDLGQGTLALASVGAEVSFDELYAGTRC
ncbi:Uma2 family endonuclease [Rubrivirga sp.]|uniref:Uma2 family endonuclease n=1 Tax=Rubrivirga sp. TaxID=1885344 RepID=UPI003B517996